MRLIEILARLYRAARSVSLPCALGALALTASAWARPTHAEPQALVFLTWSEYIEPDVVREFEQKFNAKLKFVYFESDDTRNETLVADDGRGYDVVMLDGLAIARLAKRNWLAPLSQDDIPNRKHINPRWATAHPQAERYATPYFWGTLGIAYRKDLVPDGITSWKQLLQPPEKLRGKIVMNSYSRDLTGIALKALGYSINSSDRRQLAEGERLLQGQKPFVKSYFYVSLTEQSALVTGDVWVSMIYSGDALMVKEHHPDIVFSLPSEGGVIWVDYLAVLQSSPKKQLAMQFINFLNEPRIAARVAEFVYYATPNVAAEQHLPKEYFDDPVIYPNEEFLARSEFFKKLTPRAQKLTNAIASRLSH